MSKQREVARSAGGVAFGVGLFLIPFYLNHHSTALLMAIISLGIVSLCCAVFWLFTRDSAPHSEQVASTVSGNGAISSPSIDGDNLGNQFSAREQVNYIFHPPGQSPSAESAVPSVPVPKQTGAARSRLQILEPRNVRLLFDEGAGSWFECDDPAQCLGLVIPLLNREAPQGEHAAKASRVGAILQFGGNNDPYTARVPRAFWLSKSLNQATFDIGETHCVVIGVSSGAEWHSYENPRQAPTYRSHRSSVNTYAELLSPRGFPKGDQMQFVLTLISDRGETLLQQAFLTRFLEAEKWVTTAV